METSNTPSPRTPLNLDVSFKKNYARQPSTGILKNISLTGAFLECRSENFRANEKVALTVIVAGRERKIAATVVWANSAGCGREVSPGQSARRSDHRRFDLFRRRESLGPPKRSGQYFQKSFLI